MSDSRLVVVSNRLPITIRRSGSQMSIEKSSGGLVTALEPLLQKAGGCWIGWPGVELDNEVRCAIKAAWEGSFELRPVGISDEEHADYYNGCCNEIIWPLFHEMTSTCRFEPRYWDVYNQVTRHFADAIQSSATPRDFVWVHDYHLMLVAGELRDRDSRLKLGYFHHIPFPAPDTFGRLPWRAELLSALLQYNILGFQTRQDRRNFIACVRRWMPGRVHVRRVDSKWLIELNGRSCLVGNFAISIDFDEFSNAARSAEVATVCRTLKQSIPQQSVVLGVDRLDYTKGIPERLNAYRTFLAQNEHMHGKVTFVQVVVPSREDIPSYRELRNAIEQMIGEINGRFGRPGWTPVTYMYRSLSRTELVALYRTATVALITPLRDGMNLVAKEFCACREENTGVLILSEFAGAAEELNRGALLVNPHDCQQVADTLKVALEMPANASATRMALLRKVTRENDLWNWCAQASGWSRVRPSKQRRPEVGIAIPITTYAAARPGNSSDSRNKVAAGLYS